MYRSTSFPSDNPRGFNYRPYPGSGELKPCFPGVENLNWRCEVFLTECNCFSVENSDIKTKVVTKVFV